MKRILIFDCPMGIAGDMTVGALLDLGTPFSYLKKELAKLRLKGYSLSVKSVRVDAFRAKKFSVVVKRPPAKHTSLKDIEKRIRDSCLSAKIKKNAIAIFRHLGEAEAEVHGVGLQKVHFHEVGAIDSFIDIVGTAIGLDSLKIERAYVRHLVIGRGIRTGSHGRMPVPVPGAYELLKGFSLEQSNHLEEMVTPTGAAILKTLCVSGPRIPRARLRAIGYGAGDRLFEGRRGLMRLSIAEVDTPGPKR